MKRLFLIVTTLAIVCAQALAQSSRESRQGRAGQRRADPITGRIISDTGQPIANARVGLNSLARSSQGYRTVNADEDGRFRFDDLAPGLYNITPNAAGYTTAGESTEPKYYRPGDNVEITLIKGGVITGMVTSPTGEPVVAVQVRAIRVRDGEGRPVRSQQQPTIDRQTDDRGVYRLYGLKPGSYIVQAGGRSLYYYSTQFINAYAEDVPTFFPSSTRDDAAEVTVRSGEEISGIDIRYRGERGHAVSGRITSALPPEVSNSYFPVLLVHASSGFIQSQAQADFRSGNGSFAFYGVPDGDYVLVARRSGYEDQKGVSSPRIPVKVKGADVTGLEVKVAPLGVIAGRVVIERAQATDKKTKCEIKRPLSAEETIVNLRFDDNEKRDDLSSFYISGMRSMPNEKGDFVLYDLEPGRYYIAMKPIDENYYVRAIKLAAEGQSKPPQDAARNGISVKQGERIADLTITIAEGAASLSGRVITSKEGERLAESLRVHLIPAEKESTDDLLRFYEATAQGDGSFALNNVAPGRYLILARAISDKDKDGARPLARDPLARMNLRREAEAANLSIELQPCQRVSDFTVRYSKSVGSRQ
ncbi:MAG TPA: carboxypeptidase-like regulatory domain-containing protein [Blastocatellia bacterium]|nr:carboxypeptidase-like regulatory domain-containing protein [Blastocatellia bacterium]